MLKPSKNYFLYCPKGHGNFPVTKFKFGIPKCPVCKENLLKMEEVITK